MGDIRQDLERSFEELGVTVDESVLQKCLDICSKYDITEAEELVDSWMAYSVSHVKGANPSLAHLARFEREEYGKRGRDEATNERSSLVIYKAGSADADSSEQTDILSAYGKGETEHRTDKRQRTPQNNASKKSRLQGGASPKVCFSPASFSPSVATPSSKYTSRTNSGEVVARFPTDSGTLDWSSLGQYSTKVTKETPSLPSRSMCFDLVDCVDLADGTMERLGAELCSKYSLEEPMPTRYKHPSSFSTLGRISCDADGRLNAKSVLLEGSRDTCNGDTVQLDLSAVERYSIFPGQVVAVEGFNLTGDRLVVQRLHCDAGHPPPQPPQPTEGPLGVVLAAGPFTQSDSLNYQPLLDLMVRVAEDQPHLLLLTGPFIDVNHPFIADNSVAETFQELFGELIDHIMKPLDGLRTEVVLVSSYKDCHGQCVYPTPELLHATAPTNYPKLHLVQDPCLLDVGGVKMAVTSTDILMHLGKEEVSCPPHSADRLSRLAGHVLSQRSLYPLCPPPEEVPMDPVLMEVTRLPYTPHILVVPSDLRYFIKEVSGCVVVNPERLAKGIVGGTFSRLVVSSTGVTGNIVKI